MVTEKSCHLLEQRADLHENKIVEPVQPVQTNIYQSSTYRKDWSSLNKKISILHIYRW